MSSIDERILLLGEEDEPFGNGLEIERRVSNAREALQSIRQESFDVICIDTEVLEFSLVKLLKNIMRRAPLMLIILFVRDNYSMDNIVEYMADYIFYKPIDGTKIKRELTGFLKDYNLLKSCNLIGKSEAIKSTAELLVKAAPTKLPVLIQGESGVGKELVAEALHKKSLVKDGRFMAVNCGAIPRGVMESELFGHEKGAFTGAERTREGYFELSDGGTIFLDEIGELPLDIQVKLLRILEAKNFMRVGGTEEISVNVRLIAATNKDLEFKMREGTFREDLFFRISGIRIKVPPLRKRLKDIPILAYKFIQDFSDEYDLDFGGVSSTALRKMMGYHWPGNVRELKNFIESMVVMAREQKVSVDDIAPYFDERESLGRELPVLVQEQGYPARLLELVKVLYDEVNAMRAELSSLQERVEQMKTTGVDVDNVDDFKMERVIKALQETGWDKKKAAELLNVSLRTLYRWINKYNIDA